MYKVLIFGSVGIVVCLSALALSFYWEWRQRQKPSYWRKQIEEAEKQIRRLSV